MSEAAGLRIPFGQEFTPATLGKQLTHEEVLPWLLVQTQDATQRADLSDAIQETCLAHVGRDRDRADMASHVITAMRSYGLIELGDNDEPQLTDVGAELLGAPPEQLDRVFARHILTACNGQLLVDAALRYQLRGEKPRLEDLARELGMNPTDKSISAMRAWLARAGVFGGRGYAVDQAALAELLGPNLGALYGLNDAEFEFVLAAKIVQVHTGLDFVSAPQVASTAEERNPEIRLPRKALSTFVKSLEQRGAVETRKEAGTGGSYHAVRPVGAVEQLTEKELTRLFRQSRFGFALHELEPLDAIVGRLDEGSAVERGLQGEMLAIHLCMLLGLRVVSWRSRAPASEIDLIAERTIGLAYQRWAVQVKNTGGDLTNDRVDRELGASLGTGVTHVLFIVPRSGLTAPAVAEIFARSRMSHVHVYHLSRDELAPGRISLDMLLRSLRHQSLALGAAKSEEAERRERDRSS